MPHVPIGRRRKTVEFLVDGVAVALHGDPSGGRAVQTRRVMIMVTGAFVAPLAVAAVTLTAQGQADLPDGRGRMLFSEHGCAACHTVGTFGMPAGPDLSRVGSKYSVEYLRAWLTDPASRRPWAHMPKLHLTPPEIDALAEYLASQT
jgi:mono/diheme cytochrome c family protein